MPSRAHWPAWRAQARQTGTAAQGQQRGLDLIVGLLRIAMF
jgi:hypothetical protein